MKQWYSKLNSYFRVVFWGSIVTLLCVLITLFCFFIGYKEIPLGILLGSFIELIFYFFEGLLSKKEERDLSIKWSIAILIIKFVVIIGVTFLVGYLYYSLGIKIFNIYALMGGYLIIILTLVTVSLIEKKKK